MGVKDTPNYHEQYLFDRANTYIRKIANIRGIKMIAVCNSLSMYATHPDSDIDLFIVTEKNMIWYVRFWVTMKLFLYGVWRHKDDIAENFCLSFFVTDEVLNMKNIAIKNDIYLYFWIYFLKPIIISDDIYERFCQENSWVTIDPEQKAKNTAPILENKKAKPSHWWHRLENRLIRFFLLRKTRKNFESQWYPEWIIISDTMLKFHNTDRRKIIREKIFWKNFDK